MSAILASDAAGSTGDVLRALYAQVADAAPRRANARVAGGGHRNLARPASAGPARGALAAAGRRIAALALHTAGTAGPGVKTVGAHVVAQAAPGAIRWAAAGIQVEADAVDAQLVARPALLALTAARIGRCARVAASVGVAAA